MEEQQYKNITIPHVATQRVLMFYSILSIILKFILNSLINILKFIVIHQYV